MISGVISWLINIGTRTHQPLNENSYSMLPAFSSVKVALLAPLGHGGTLVESKPFDRRVVGSNPALAATYT